MNAISGRIQKKRTVTQIHVGSAKMGSRKRERENLSTGQRRMTEGGPACGKLRYGRRWICRTPASGQRPLSVGDPEREPAPPQWKCRSKRGVTMGRTCATLHPTARRLPTLKATHRRGADWLLSTVFPLSRTWHYFLTQNKRNLT